MLKLLIFIILVKKLSLEILGEMSPYLKGKVICCGDFNAHSTLWDNCSDGNGAVIEELMEIKNLVCLNDGKGTRINVRTGTETAIDLTLVSNSLVGKCIWKVVRDTTIGSDHYPIVVEVNVRVEECITEGVNKWCFENADWEKYRRISEQEMGKIEVKGEVDKVNKDICNAIMLAANQTIPKKKGRRKKKMVPRWTKECEEAIKCRNKAFKTLKKNHSFQNFIEYKRKQAQVRIIIKNTKKILLEEVL